MEKEINKFLRKARLVRNNDGNIDMITMAIVSAVMFAISVPIIFSVIGGLDMSSIDDKLQATLGKGATFTPAANATNSLITNVNTFYTIGPIYIVVVAAVGIISAVLMLRGRSD